MNGKDKRQAPRDKHDSVIEIFDAGGKFFASGRLGDFSSTGASFSVAGTVKLPEKFRVRLRLLGKGVIEAEASVVRIAREKNSVSYGIKFAAMKTVYPTGEIKTHWL